MKSKIILKRKLNEEATEDDALQSKVHKTLQCFPSSRGADEPIKSPNGGLMDSSQFLDRLRSFTPILWPMFHPITPVELASRGYRLIDYDLVKCDLCKSVAYPKLADISFSVQNQKLAIDVVREKLFGNHSHKNDGLCPWKSVICPESYSNVTEIAKTLSTSDSKNGENSSSLMDYFLNNLENLYKELDNHPFTTKRTRETLITPSIRSITTKSFPSAEPLVLESCLVFFLTGWCFEKSCDENSNLKYLKCSLCNRKCGSWLYRSCSKPIEGEENEIPVDSEVFPDVSHSIFEDVLAHSLETFISEKVTSEVKVCIEKDKTGEEFVQDLYTTDTDAVLRDHCHDELSESIRLRRTELIDEAFGKLSSLERRELMVEQIINDLVASSFFDKRCDKTEEITDIAHDTTNVVVASEDADNPDKLKVPAVQNDSPMSPTGSDNGLSEDNDDNTSDNTGVFIEHEDKEIVVSGEEIVVEGEEYENGKNNSSILEVESVVVAEDVVKEQLDSNITKIEECFSEESIESDESLIEKSDEEDEENTTEESDDSSNVSDEEDCEEEEEFGDFEPRVGEFRGEEIVILSSDDDSNMNVDGQDDTKQDALSEQLLPIFHILDLHLPWCPWVRNEGRTGWIAFSKMMTKLANDESIMDRDKSRSGRQVGVSEVIVGARRIEQIERASKILRQQQIHK